MKINQLISLQAKLNKIGHAYLVIGSIVIEEINKVLKVSNPDMLIIEEIPIKIEVIKKLNHWVSIKPHSSTHKLIVIKNFETITLDAANTLLKMLEEPPPDTIFILQAEKIEKVIPTIQSRCQIIKEKFVEDDVPENYFSYEELSAKSIWEKFSYADKIYQSPDLTIIINLWEEELRKQLKENKNVLRVLSDLETTRRLLSTNTSVKLLIENILLDF